MRGLTRAQPKPLLEVRKKTLIEYQVERLVNAGYSELVINLSYLGDQITGRLGDGTSYGASIAYSWETRGPLGTGGGVRQALPLLGRGPVMIVNADVWTDYPYADVGIPGANGVHLVLVPNPDHVSAGDFALKDIRLSRYGAQLHTFSGIGVYDTALFAGPTGESFSLVRIIESAISYGRATGELYRGAWMDVGTPERYNLLKKTECR